ncbi:hypothetical protein ACFFF5_09525 [Lederbergia wuyishanensis]|uniref:Uncharacterized protein n=1 Tax=Lederbergia wuyishanensis TaxID=1347903 RepID=A0ABU0D7R7_9BACI|nr:hypothetical protein [Lederbergia wuyishanensis]MCJ8009074.1 hypothetical protein [Lederbergia wuyishanensis]MDQ0344410.1 hypothetical protein [Lederbergia wuyishanensis]
MGGFIISYATKIVKQVMDDVFFRKGFSNTLTGGVFEAREAILDKFLFLINEGIKKEDEQEMKQYLIDECHYTEHEIRAAMKGKVALHGYAECIKLFK